MRKVFALFLAATLLSVSSVPLLVEAASCAMPEHSAVEVSEHGEHMHHNDAVEDAHAGHDHTASLVADWQKERIECGCGCHRNVDSLPHLLAPHTVDIAGFHAGMATAPASEQAESELLVRAASVPIPPPQLI